MYWPASGRLVVSTLASQPNHIPLANSVMTMQAERDFAVRPRRQSRLDNRQQQDGQREHHAGFHHGGDRGLAETRQESERRADPRKHQHKAKRVIEDHR